jgi:predicted acetyltransferase
MWADAPSHRDGMSAWMYAVAEDGFAVYRGAEASGAEPDRVSVRLLYGADDATEAALFRFLADIDLVDRLDLGYRPLDDPLRWRLADPRRLETTGVTDFLWVRILDTAAALTARHYAGTGRLVLEVVAPAGAAPDPAVGRWVLDAGPDGTTCVPAGPGERTDLRLGLTELGALYLGGVAPSVLRSAGRIDEERPGALAVADRLFPTPMAPRSGTGF